MNRWINIFEYI